MKLTFKSETGSKITFTYDKPPGPVEGYVYFAGGARVSRTFNPNDLEVTFGKVPSGEYSVKAVGFDVLDEANWPDTPPPPTGFGTGIGYLKLGSSEIPATHPSDYDLIALGGSGFPNSLTSKAIAYRSGTNVPDAAWDNGVPIAECRANGWILKDSAGAEIFNKGYPYAKLGDVGNPDYQRRWCEHSEQTFKNLGAEGFYADDTIGFYGMWWNAPPPKYPNAAAWDAAMISFCKAIWDYFQPKGFYVSHNAGEWQAGNEESNNGMLKMRWWAKVGPYSNGLMAESWMFLKQWGHGVRVVGTGWQQNWDATRAYHKFCNGEPYPVSGGSVQLARPIDFIGLDYGDANDEAAHRYCLLSFLLDYQRKGPVHMWQRTDTPNPWTAVNDQVLALGDPTGPATKSGNVWTRPFEHGQIKVDSTAGTATIA